MRCKTCSRLTTVASSSRCLRSLTRCRLLRLARISSTALRVAYCHFLKCRHSKFARHTEYGTFLLSLVCGMVSPSTTLHSIWIQGNADTTYVQSRLASGWFSNRLAGIASRANVSTSLLREAAMMPVMRCIYPRTWRCRGKVPTQPVPYEVSICNSTTKSSNVFLAMSRIARGGMSHFFCFTMIALLNVQACLRRKLPSRTMICLFLERVC